VPEWIAIPPLTNYLSNSSLPLVCAPHHRCAISFIVAGTG
jgi:hypothetical protein